MTTGLDATQTTRSYQLFDLEYKCWPACLCGYRIIVYV